MLETWRRDPFKFVLTTLDTMHPGHPWPHSSPKTISKPSGGIVQWKHVWPLCPDHSSRIFILPLSMAKKCRTMGWWSERRTRNQDGEIAELVRLSLTRHCFCQNPFLIYVKNDIVDSCADQKEQTHSRRISASYIVPRRNIAIEENKQNETWQKRRLWKTGRQQRCFRIEIRCIYHNLLAEVLACPDCSTPLRICQLSFQVWLRLVHSKTQTTFRGPQFCFSQMKEERMTHDLGPHE